MNRKTALYCKTALKSKSEIDRQKTRLSEYVKQNCINEYRFYIDDGHSSRNLQRPGLSMLLSDIHAGNIDTVITDDISRITRNIEQYYNWVRLLKSNDITFVALNNIEQQSEIRQEKSKIQSLVNFQNLASLDDSTDSISKIL